MPNNVPTVDSLVINSALLVYSKQPWHNRTFDDYANDIILQHIKSFAQSHLRLDVVFDVYYDDSLRGKARRKRGIELDEKWPEALDHQSHATLFFGVTKTKPNFLVF